MNIYRYKNCVIFTLWNYHLPWADRYPEIKMHGICIVNVITNQLRLWNNKYKDGRSEVVDISDETRNHILDELSSRARQNSYMDFVTGVSDIENPLYEFMSDCEDFIFIRENYIGDQTQNKVELKNQWQAWMDYQRENCNPKIVRTVKKKVDPYYMLGVTSCQRRKKMLL